MSDVPETLDPVDRSNASACPDPCARTFNPSLAPNHPLDMKSGLALISIMPVIHATTSPRDSASSTTVADQNKVPSDACDRCRGYMRSSVIKDEVATFAYGL